MGFWDFSLFIRLLPMLFVAWVAWIILRSPAQHGPNRLLAGFLGLVGLEILIEVGQGFVMLATSHPSQGLAGLAHLLGLADPPLLLAYALRLTRPRGWSGWRWFWSAYAAAAGVLFAADPTHLFEDPRFLEILYVNGTYLAAFVSLARLFLKDPRRYFVRQSKFLALAVGFAGLSRSVAIIEQIQLNGDYDLAASLPLASLAVAVALLVLFWAALSWTSGGARPLLPLAAGLAALLVVYFLALEGMSRFEAASALHGLSNLHYAARWVLFAVLIGYGVLRYQLFDFDYQVREAGVLLASLVLGLVAAMGAGAAALQGGGSLLEGHLLGLAAGAVLAVLAWVLLRSVWTGGPVDPLRYRERRLEIYEATLEYAIQKPSWSREDALFVETLREVFEISTDEHERVVAALKGSLEPVRAR